LNELYVYNSSVAIDNDQVQGQILAPDLVREAISDQDNIIKSPINNQEIVPGIQTQQPQVQSH
jgi:hypothetical protein